MSLNDQTEEEEEEERKGDIIIDGTFSALFLIVLVAVVAIATRNFLKFP